MPEIAVVDPDPTWPDQFAAVADALWSTVGADVVRIDHIGSTSVAGLAAKDVIDVQVTVASDDGLGSTVEALSRAGFVHKPGLTDLLTGCDDAEQLRKEVFVERPGDRRANIHVRIAGRRNQRYALLFRDYLRAD